MCVCRNNWMELSEAEQASDDHCLLLFDVLPPLLGARGNAIR